MSGCINAAAQQGPAVPHPIYRCNLDRIRRDFPGLYPTIEKKIQEKRMIVVELI
jgi:hypothetical protein